jgi:hypothetical protein
MLLMVEMVAVMMAEMVVVMTAVVVTKGIRIRRFAAWLCSFDFTSQWILPYVYQD